MRWLLLKDLQILRRSPLVLALLVAYPVAIGILIGFALSGDEGKPRVAFLNEAGESASTSVPRRASSEPRRPAPSSASGSSAWTWPTARRPRIGFDRGMCLVR